MAAAGDGIKHKQPSVTVGAVRELDALLGLGINSIRGNRHGWRRCYRYLSPDKTFTSPAKSGRFYCKILDRLSRSDYDFYNQHKIRVL